MTMTDEPDSVDELISRYLDGEATEAEIARVEADPALLARAESMRAAIEAVAAPVDIPTAELDRIRATALASSTTTEQVTDLAAAAAAKRQSAERRNRFMAVAAAFVMLAVGVVAIRALPGGDDDEADTATAETGDTDSSSDASDDSGGDSDDAGDLSVESSAATGADEMAEEDDMAEEEGDDDMAEAEAESDMAFDDADDMADEAPAEADDGERVEEDAPVEPLPFAAIDLLPNELPPVADSAELLDIITAEYTAPIDAETNVGEPVDELLDRRCLAVVELLIESLPDGVASVEPVVTELAGVPVTVYIATGFDGSLVVVSHPTDDCETVTVEAIIPPS